MACVGFRHAGITDSVIQKHNIHSGRVSGSTNLAVKIPDHKLSTAVQAAAVACDSGRRTRSDLSLFHGGLDIHTENKIDYNDRTSIESPRVSETLENMIHNNVTEIVKNVTHAPHAPLLVQIYADGKVTTEKSPVEKVWRNPAKRRSKELDGVILVEELRSKSEYRFGEDFSDGDREYGVLIQGKVKGRNECNSECYLLKTSSVYSGGNGIDIGNVCTHFCLMKVQSFHKKAFEQFRDSWLLQ